MSKQRKAANRQAKAVAEFVPEPTSKVDFAGNAIQEALLTTILRAGETLAAPRCRSGSTSLSVSHAMPEGHDSTTAPEDFGGLLDVIARIAGLLQDDERLTAQVAALPEAFSDGNALRLLFRNLFPNCRRRKQLGPDGKPVLTEREVELLRLAAGDFSHIHIAANLGISVQTVRTHFRNIFRKLGVSRPIQAIVHAAALGYLDWDTYEAVYAKAQQHGCISPPFEAFCSQVGQTDPPFYESEMQPLAAFGLLLLTMSSAAARQIRGDARSEPPARGVICELNAQGEVVQSFGTETLETARSLVIAPPHAAQHGFTPGNLFVAHDMHPQRGLNRAAITEFTPEGKYVRTFCGGAEVGTRLIGAISPVFAADGRLLASSGWLTAAILAFDANGTIVKRFAKGCYHQIGVAGTGWVYGAEYIDPGGCIQVFDGSGQAIHSFDTQKLGALHGLAVDSRGHVFVGRHEHDFGHRVIAEFDANGKSMREFLVPGFNGGLLTIDAHDRLLVPCPLSGDVKILSLDGTILRQIDLHGKVKPLAVAIGAAGKLWVCGQSV